jgi:hypothetical protein
MTGDGTVYWFGAPWPSAKTPAPVCADPRLRIENPRESFCTHCGRLLHGDDQGVRLTALGAPWFVYYHAKCFLAEVIGEGLADQIWAQVRDE